MISVQLGVAAERNSSDIVTDAQFLNSLLNDARFQGFILRAADTCVRDWSQGNTLADREEAYTKLKGLRLLEKQMQSEIEHGLRLSK